MYYLDTNTCIYFLNGTNERVRTKLLSTVPKEIAIPSIVKAELLLGAYKSRKREYNIEKIEQFLEPFTVVPFEDEMTYVYAEIRSAMETKGIVIGPNDLLIASIVKYKNGILVTNNVSEFSRIEGLLIDNWAQ
ncbi:type II toxin-antitoxin system tRNA(fMet)-specific endonuclease VapC [Gracilinema caldarium]|uniref:PilT protein domain protein n=1 Tax=Gracilinema caldarium (strain ATCC 51460 / DSM 7334 / H1) TaxID=744872 RepID=F8F185_GRAC1|nr:type II toxin-antitoxin system VapC family toxin [Gracilinema caldarium]AEJ18729.1 PilT protein domain protein [Gracilinema caldarium DSM 7334]